MFKPSALLRWIMPCCAAGASEPADPDAMNAMLDKDNIGILSAACCDTTAGPKDAELKRNVMQAMALAGDQRAVVVQTITSAQQHLRRIELRADAGQQQLVQSVVALFQANGLSIFPVLIVNGRVVYYGGVPSAQMIQDSLVKSPATHLEGLSQVNKR